jgi:hypothetical protein
MRRVMFLGAAIACSLAACTNEVPLVDRPGMTFASYQHDLADCQNNPPAFSVGNSTTKCLKAKGYTILGYGY